MECFKRCTCELKCALLILTLQQQQKLRPPMKTKLFSTLGDHRLHLAAKTLTCCWQIFDATLHKWALTGHMVELSARVRTGERNRLHLSSQKRNHRCQSVVHILAIMEPPRPPPRCNTQLESSSSEMLQTVKGYLFTSQKSPAEMCLPVWEFSPLPLVWRLRSHELVLELELRN